MNKYERRAEYWRSLGLECEGCQERPMTHTIDFENPFGSGQTRGLEQVPSCEECHSEIVEEINEGFKKAERSLPHISRNGEGRELDSSIY